MTVVGGIALDAALACALLAAVLLVWGLRAGRAGLVRAGYGVVYAFFLATVIAAAVLLQAFLRGDYGFAYVAEHSATGLSVFYRVAGFWAGEQGSFLLWLLLLALAAVVIALLDFVRLERLTAGAVTVLCLVAAILAALMVVDSGCDPFVVAAAGAEAQGLSPLLLHPAMVLHPPALFAGYVGLTIPFAYAIATLVLGRGDQLWVRRSRKWAVAGWLFLSLGIGLGAWWAYVVLSFGGYWAWDPVENTSLVPWLTATALLHVFSLYGARGLFRRWAVCLAAATFFFVVLATWTARTGLVYSVHAFAKDELLTVVLTTMLAVTAVASVALTVWRWRRFADDDGAPGLAPRELVCYATTLLLTLSAVAIAVCTVVVPLTTHRDVGAGAYDAVARPLGVVVLALMAVCPLLSRRRGGSAAFRRALTLPLTTAALSAVLWLYLGFQSNVWGFVGLLVCGFAFGAVVESVLRAARLAARPGRGLWSGLGRAFTGSRTRTASYVVHLGMVLVVAGLIGSTIYKVETSVTNLAAERGSTASVGDYALTYRSMDERVGAQDSLRCYAHFTVTRDGEVVGALAPYTDIYSDGSASSVRAVILGRPFEDLFVVADTAFDTTSTKLDLSLMIFPLIRWVWIGAVLLCVGAAVSLWPKRGGGAEDARGGAAEDARRDAAAEGGR